MRALRWAPLHPRTGHAPRTDGTWSVVTLLAASAYAYVIDFILEYRAVGVLAWGDISFRSSAARPRTY